MDRLVVCQETDKNTTVLSNRFIEEFMTQADGREIKVYLYLLMVMSAGEYTSVMEMASRFCIEEEAVVEAIRYWEREGLLEVSYNASDRPVRIQLVDLRFVAPKTGQTRGKIREIRETRETADTRKQISDSRDSIKELKNNREIKEFENNKEFAKKEITEKHITEKQITEKQKVQIPPRREYSMEDMAEYGERDEGKTLIFIAEQYLHKTLTKRDAETLFYLFFEVGMSEELVDYLLQYCSSRGKTDFRYIEKVGISWAERGVRSPRDADENIWKYDKYIYDVLNALGRNGNPTDVEATYVRRWRLELGFSMELILEACQRTVMAVDSNRISYCNKIMESWHKKGIKGIAEVAAEDLAHAKRANGREKKVFQGSGQGGAASNNSFNRFIKNDYDIDELEAKLVSN